MSREMPFLMVSVGRLRKDGSGIDQALDRETGDPRSPPSPRAHDRRVNRPREETARVNEQLHRPGVFPEGPCYEEAAQRTAIQYMWKMPFRIMNHALHWKSVRGVLHLAG